jgi:hypothetical protein
MLDIPEQHTGFTAQNTGISIELRQSVELAKIDQRTRSGREAAIAIASSIATRKKWAPPIRGQLVRP